MDFNEAGAGLSRIGYPPRRTAVVPIAGGSAGTMAFEPVSFLTNPDDYASLHVAFCAVPHIELHSSLAFKA
ncbi:hypothetical protein [Burkholderia sp. WAC0059]|uniref:hypothetical protein n=1 Tax=Burkholderia sp. WAC0059 TaxID=2066022 RepID=UPI0011AF75B4|nr:hypothetical protein [Burkholderia sp. WAC0059]